jgi:hypothetical protein
MFTQPQRFLSVLAGPHDPSRCKFCGRPIMWATKLSTPKRDGGRNKAMNVPLEVNALVLRYDRTEGGLKVEVYDARALHFVNCRKRPERSTRPRMFGGRG